MAAEKRVILAIDDDPGDAEILRRYLLQVLEVEPEFIHIDNPADGMARLERQDIQLIFLDYQLGSVTGLEVVRDIRAAGDMRPIIVLTGRGDEYVATDLMRSGADDYILKGDLQVETLRRSMETVAAQHVRRVVESENRKLVENLKARNKEILHLAYAMTHDLQTPLASLTGSVHALENHLGGCADDSALKWISRIATSVDRMAQMLDDLMSYAKAGNQQLKPVPVNMAELIQSTCEELAIKAESRGVTLHVAGRFPEITGDPGQLSRVFSNLIENAIKFMPEDSDGRVAVTYDCVGGVNRFTVADNGPGIEPSQLENVFLPFKRATNRAPGSGFGLANVRRIVQQHGGRVWLESDGKTGTKVMVDMPAAAEYCSELEVGNV